jgi:CheY-specific phosphatase CheX
MESAEEVQETLREVFINICELSLAVSATGVGACPTSYDSQVYSGVVHILGDWNGSVSVEMSAIFADKLTRKLLDLNTDPEVYHLQQVLQELANMTGGNLKPLLGESCALSTPKSHNKIGYGITVPDSEEKACACFKCIGTGLDDKDSVVVVRLFKSTNSLSV